MDVVVVPTNKPIARIDEPDLIFLSERAKFEAICDDIEKRQIRVSRCSLGPPRLSALRC